MCLPPACLLACLPVGVLCGVCRLKSLNPRVSNAERAAAVEEAMQEMRSSITGMAGALGTEHLLVSAASRYLAQLSVMLGQKQ